MKQVEVQIMGQGYVLGCPEGGEQRLTAAVDRVDSAMCKIRDAGKIKARDRIAVLAALNLAYMLTERPAAPARSSAPATEAAADLPSAEYINNLISRLDQALDSDGHLI